MEVYPEYQKKEVLRYKDKHADYLISIVKKDCDDKEESYLVQILKIYRQDGMEHREIGDKFSISRRRSTLIPDWDLEKEVDKAS